MIRIAVVDDEEDSLDTLKAYLERYRREKGLSFDIKTFTDGDGITANYRPVYDIILLDVKMPFMDGISAAEMIRDVDPEVVLLFITNLPQYAIKGYAVEALDYVLKPVSYFAFSQKLERAIARIKQKTKRFLTISVKGGLHKLDVADICYIESWGHNMFVHTKQREYKTAGKMKDIEAQLAPFHFYRGNYGYIINLEHVNGVVDGCALVHGKKLLLSRSRKNGFLEALTNYIGGGTQ
ncbi:MAG: LytTR family DNA-binding domain-containing protein [Spirochaetaceae bacterium]|nr:LytTR family DNA-binding domain-containing protein [Spirochaetaceae bacterium]